MKDSLENRCEQFIQNRDILREGFRSAGAAAMFFPFCSMIFTERGIDADCGLMRESIKLIRENSRALSGFRGHGLLPMAAMMASSESPARRFEKTVTLYGLLSGHFHYSESLPLAAMAVADIVPEGKYIALVDRAMIIYNSMKESHRLITGADDFLPAMMLAMSEQSDEVICRETEATYKMLLTKFKTADAVQSLSHILTMTAGRAPDKAKRLSDLWDALREEKCTYPKGYELPALGVLSLVPANIPTLAEEVAEVDEFLSRQKGYGFLELGKSQRRMHAAMLVSAEHIIPTDAAILDEAALRMTASLITAQQSIIVTAAASVIKKITK